MPFREIAESIDIIKYMIRNGFEYRGVGEVDGGEDTLKVEALLGIGWSW